MDPAFGVIYWVSASFVLAVWFSLAVDRIIHGKWLWQKTKKDRKT